MNCQEQDTYGMYKRRTDGGPGPGLMGANTLDGNDVYNRQDQDLGDIKEIMLDMATGRVAYAVLSYGGFETWKQYIALSANRSMAFMNPVGYMIGGAALAARGAVHFDPDVTAREIRAANPGLDAARANGLAWEMGRRGLERAQAIGLMRISSGVYCPEYGRYVR